jgi:predicted nucleic acid-binding protein
VANRKTVPRRRPRSGRSSAAAKGVPAWRYIESSALVAAMLEGDVAAKASIRAPGQRITSALTIAETSRAILRARLSGRVTAQQLRAALLTLQRFARRCHIVSVTDTILTRAGRPFPVEPVRTLDAIHLATAEALGDPPALVIIVTRNLRVRENSTALGFPVE